MDPVTLSLLLGGMGMNFMGGLFGGGGGQDRQTFEGERRGNLSIDPRDLLAGATTAVGRHGDILNEMLMNSVDLPGAYAQAPPSFSGGGLPMPIGVTGRDPALDDPSRHLSLPGMRTADPFQGIGNQMSGDPRNPAPAQTSPSGRGQLPPKDFPRQDPVDPVRLRRPGKDMMSPQGDDSQEALAAFQLLGL